MSHSHTCTRLLLYEGFLCRKAVQENKYRFPFKKVKSSLEEKLIKIFFGRKIDKDSLCQKNSLQEILSQN